MGLGKNPRLGALLCDFATKEQHVDDIPDKQEPNEIPVDAVYPNARQPRRVFDEEALQALADSIQQYGLVQPIVVQKRADGTYELVAGERRLRAAKLCGMKTIAAIVREYTPDIAAGIALIENLQREDLNAMEEAAAYASLIRDFGLTQDEAAQKVGKSRSHVANMVRLLHLPEEIQGLVSEGTLSMGQARPLLQLPTKELQLEGARRIIDQGLSARQAEKMANLLLEQSQNKGNKDAPQPDVYLESLQDKMKMYLGTSVAIHVGKNKKKGKIEIAFTSEEEFERLLAMLTDEQDKVNHSPSVPFTV
jgi:ParB family chromosome partitioning protein